MDLKKMHLEEIITLPKNYKEVIADRREITPELKEEGFGGGTWGKDRRYNYFYKEIEPFLLRVGEQDVKKDESDGTLHYQLEFQVNNLAFAPFLKFIKEWGKKNCKKGSKLNDCFISWLIEYFDFSPANDYEVYTRTPVNNDEVMCQVESEIDFYKLLKDISKGFRILATEHASDPFDLVAEFEYDASDLKGKEYWDMANNILTPMILRGLIEGLTAFRQKVESGETEDETISIEIKKKKKTMLFYYGDDCRGTPFYEFEIGSVLSKCLNEIQSEDLEYERELSHWFSDAASNLPEKVYQGLNVCIEVPETGGDPVFEHME